jgi:hypothetical protein
MKKLYYLALSLITFASIAVSCSKDDDEKTFEVSTLIGEYEVIGGDNFTACPDGNNKIFKITETNFMEGQTDDTGCAIDGSYASFEYTYVNGNTFDCGLGTYKVTSFDGTHLELEIASPLAPGSKTKVSMDKK